MKRILAGLAIAVVASIPVFAAQAQPNPYRAIATAAATKSAGAAGTCTDSTFLTSAATDFGGLANVFSQFNAEDSNHLIASGLILTGLRQKYEDLGNVAPR